MSAEETRQKTIQESIRLLNSLGYKAVTMDRIAAEMHISKRTIYETFPNKEELIMACIGQVYDELEASRVKTEQATQEPLLLTLYLIRSTAMHIYRYARFMQETKLYYPEILKDFARQRSAKFNEGIRQMLKEAQEHNDLREDVDIDMTLKILNTYFNKCDCNTEESEQDRQRQMSETCYIILRGLMSVKAIERYEKKMPQIKAIVELGLKEG